MISLSARAKEAIKTGLAVVIVYAIAMQMGWDKPYWAGFTVVTINVLSAGVSLTRGITRSVGTLVGALAALVIIGLFPQERWWLMLCVSIYIGFCTYMLTGKRQSYFWFLASLTCLVVIAVNSPPQSEKVFQLAVTRTSETAMGALVYILVAVFLWPRSSVGEFSEASRELSAIQGRLYRAYRDEMLGQGFADDSRQLRLQEIQLVTRVGQLLNAAETDSYTVCEVRHQWRRFHRESTALMEALERWQLSFAEIRPLEVTKLLSNLAPVCSEIDLRLAQIERMLGGEPPDRAPQVVTLAVDLDEMRALTRFEQAAVVVTQAQLEILQGLSRSLYDGISDIRGYAGQAAEPVTHTPRRSGLAIDPDRLEAVIRVVATLWIGFLLWVYINPPGHALFPMMATIFALIIAMVPQVSGSLLFLSWGGGGAFAGVLYVFVMPHLSGFVELAGLIFVAFFVMHYLLGQPRQAVARMFAMVSFLILIGIDNQQSYSFSQYANDMAWLMLALGLAVTTTYIPASPRHEKAFLRLLRRFFRHAEFLISAQALDEQQGGIAARWKTALYRNDLLEIPEKLASFGRQIDYRMLPATTPEQVQALVTRLQALAYRVEDLIEAKGYPQAPLVEKYLLDELGDWLRVIQERFRRRADPTQAIGSVAHRLAARLARLEALIDETFAQEGEVMLSTEDYKNFFRLLGSYRGLSEAAVAYAQLADAMDWERWREARF